MKSKSRWIRIAAAGVGIAMIVLLIQHPWTRAKNATPTASDSTPHPAIPPSETNYAGSESCRECHRAEYDRWAQSHHGLAERNLEPALDKAAFDPPRTFHHGTQSTAVRIADGNYELVANDLSGKASPHIARRVIGVDPLRQFLVDAPGGRLQATEAAYDPARNEWFDVYGNEDRQSGEWGHWTGRGMNWNSMCAACHNTRVRKNYDEQSDTYQTEMAEMSVGCEACHGPMQAHVARERRGDGKTRGGGDGGTRGRGDGAMGGGGDGETGGRGDGETRGRGHGRTRGRDDGRGTGPATRVYSASADDPTLAHFTRDQITDTCASCHSRRGDITGEFVPGESFFDHYSLAGVDETGNFYPDGQIHEEDYEFSAFLGSKMYSAGVRCIDCHDVHSGKTLLEGNALCMKCHIGAFPKAPVINPLSHTFHTPTSAGSQCVSCHMPQTKYMQRHGRHDHGFTIPDPLLTKQFGVPNACNRCHGDKDANWAIAVTNKWYGEKMKRPSHDRAFAIAEGRKGNLVTPVSLMALAEDATQPFYWRSACVRLLGRWADNQNITPMLIGQLKADHPMVRESAAIALGPLVDHDPNVREAMGKLLTDRYRNVRIAAAHAMGSRVDPDSKAALEFLACLKIQSDQPAGQLQRAIFDATYQDNASALAHLERALAWDKRSPDIRHQAAVLYGMLGRPQEALAQIKAACQLDPANAQYGFAHGLAAAEVGNTAEALEAMEKAVRLDPGFSRAWYNLALMQQKAGKPDAALNAFKNAEAADADDAQIPYAEAVLLSQLGRNAEARQTAQRALAKAPGYPEAMELLRELPP